MFTQLELVAASVAAQFPGGNAGKQTPGIRLTRAGRLNDRPGPCTQSWKD